jgi:AcrR family transcriptional regulator
MSQSPATGRARGAGRPSHRASRGAARRAEIMAAAEDVFQEVGFSNTTMDAIAARAGSSKATFYKHFGSKEALFAEVIRSRVPDITGASGDALQGDGDPHAVLVDWGLQILQRVTAPRAVALYKLILSELPRSPELGRIFYAQGPATVQRQLAAYIRAATREGRLNCREPDRAAVLLSSLIFADSFGWAIVGQIDQPWDKRKARKHVEESVTIFLARYGAGHGSQRSSVSNAARWIQHAD